MAQSVSYSGNAIPITGADNSAFGFQSLKSNIIGYNNSSFGWKSLFSNTYGTGNAAFGYQSLYANTTGNFNAAFGIQTLLVNTTGTNNSAFGTNALLSNTTGNQNTAVGSESLKNNTLGNVNTAIGNGSLSSNTSGSRNCATGFSSLSLNITGSDNTAIGYFSLPYNSTGTYNSAFGVNSMYNNTTGVGNTAIGYQSLSNNITGSRNTTIGYNANVSVDGLTNATAIGYNATVNSSNTIQLGNRFVTKVYAGTGINATIVAGGLQVTGGSLATGNVLTSDAFGVATWQAPTGGGAAGWGLTGNAGTVDGTNFIGTTDNVPFNIKVNNNKAGKIDPILFNTFYGENAGADITFGNPDPSFPVAIHNIGIGKNALTHNTTGYSNTAIGGNALMNNTTGNANVGIGLWTLQYCESGSGNTSVGTWSSGLIKDGRLNTALGYESNFETRSGSENVGIGYFANGNNRDGNKNTCVGSFSITNALSITNSAAFGAYAIVNADNKIRFGDPTITVVEGSVAYTPSDGRFKNNIKEEDVIGLEFIKRLRPVVYNFDTKKFTEFLTQTMPDSISSKYFDRDFLPSTAIRQSGFIAQEVEAAAKEIGYDFNGVHVPETKDDNYSLAYAQFTVPLVKAVQELSKQNEDLKKEMAELRSMLTALKSNTVEGSIKITEATTEAKLYQNAPNPFSKTTTIRYSLPSSAKRATISITTMEGKKVKTFELNSKNGEAINIDGGELSAGIYIYTLVVDDLILDSKRMVLTK